MLHKCLIQFISSQNKLLIIIAITIITGILYRSMKVDKVSCKKFDPDDLNVNYYYENQK